jgi:OTU-like cysteine protease
MISTHEFNRQYEIVRNNANGNCLFESVAYLINNLPEEDLPGDRKMSHKDIRMLVSDFYNNFDRDIKYPKETIENSVILGLLYDNDDEDENGEYITHDKNVSNDRVWASMTDLLVCSIIFDVDINLYINYENGFKLEKIKYQYKNNNAIYILYNGINHFEALDKTIFW